MLDIAFKAIDAAAEELIAARGIPGLALALTDRDRLLRVSTYGFANLAARERVRPEMLFEIGSIGKSFTAIALLQEHEAGNLDLHAPVTDYLPWFSVQSRFSRITLHHLLTHTAGIVNTPDFSPDSRAEVWNLRNTETAWEPGSKFSYSNVGYKALGLVLHALTGNHYAEDIQRRILDPLRMQSTAPVITNQLRGSMARGYTPLYDDRPYRTGDALAEATWLETDTADGCIAASAADMSAYLRMLLNRGAGPGGRLFSDDTFRLLTGSHIEIDGGSGMHYGYGLFTREVDGRRYVQHSGGMIGYVANLMCDMDSGLGAIVLVNATISYGGIADFAIEALRAAMNSQHLPGRSSVDVARVESASEFVGTYTDGDQNFVLTSDESWLTMGYPGANLTLEPRGNDYFFVPHPDFALFLLHFERDGDTVTGASHGNRWFHREGQPPPIKAEPTPEWNAYVGHYRSFSPWGSNFRIVSRRDSLLLIFPSGIEIPLKQDGATRFRLGPDTPGHIAFGPIVESEAIGATLAGTPYYRVFTP